MIINSNKIIKMENESEGDKITKNAKKKDLHPENEVILVEDETTEKNKEIAKKTEEKHISKAEEILRKNKEAEMDDTEKNKEEPIKKSEIEKPEEISKNAEKPKISDEHKEKILPPNPEEIKKATKIPEEHKSPKLDIQKFIEAEMEDENKNFYIQKENPANKSLEKPKIPEKSKEPNLPPNENIKKVSNISEEKKQPEEKKEAKSPEKSPEKTLEMILLELNKIKNNPEVYYGNLCSILHRECDIIKTEIKNSESEKNETWKNPNYQKIKSLQNQIEESYQQISELLLQNKEKQNLLSKIFEENKNLQPDFDKKISELRKKQLELVKYHQDLENCKNVLENLFSKYEAVSNFHEKECENYIPLLISDKVIPEISEGHNRKLQQELEISEKQIKNHEEIIKNLQESIKNLENSNSQIHNEISEYKKTVIENIPENIEILNENLSKTMHENEKVSSKVIEKEHEISEIKNQTLDIQKTIEKGYSQVEEKEKMNKKIKNDIEILNSALKAKNTEKENLLTNFDKSKKNLKHLTKMHDESIEKTRSEINDLNNLNEEIKILEKDPYIKDYETMKDELNTKIQENHKKIYQLFTFEQELIKKQNEIVEKIKFNQPPKKKLMLEKPKKTQSELKQIKYKYEENFKKLQHEHDIEITKNHNLQIKSLEISRIEQNNKNAKIEVELLESEVKELEKQLQKLQNQ